MMMGYIKHFFWETSQSCYLTTSITALATIASYSLAITLSGSTANVSVLEVSSQPVAIRAVYMQMIYGENFEPDDNISYAATNRGTVFINFGMALNEDEEFTHTISSQPCSQCLPVGFLNNNTVVISPSTSSQGVILDIF